MNKLINKYVYYTSSIIINDKKIALNKDNIFYCLDYEDSLFNNNDFYLIEHIINKNITLWVIEQELIIIPANVQNTLEIIYGNKVK